jgi:hypothetical protein
VYAGHAAIALYAKSRRTRISLAVLVPVAFAPDWIEWILTSTTNYVTTGRDRFLSHALVFVVPCAVVVGLLYWLIAARRGATVVDAAVLATVYLSHWAADFITGIKPTWPGGPNVGLMLYSHTWWDAALECALVLVCWWAYQRSLPPPSRRREVGWIIPGSLLVLELISALLQQPVR